MTNIAELLTDNLDIWTSAIERRSTAGRGRSKKFNLYGIEKLRALILDLAISGKLVAQSNTDEPVQELLKRIEVEKSRLLKLGVAKKPKIANPQSTPPFRLPDSWRWSQIAEIGLLNPRNEISEDVDTSFVPMPMIAAEYGTPNEHEVRPWSEIRSGYTHFSEGDVGLAKITPCFENGKSTAFRNLTGGFGSGTTELHIVRPLIVEANYILIFLKSRFFIESGIPKMTGTAGQKRVPLDYFAYSPFPLPPLAEQHRIVAKVDELMGLCDRLEAGAYDAIAAHQLLVTNLLATLTSRKNAADFAESWKRIETHFDTLFTTEESINHLKQTILQLAVMGKLVPQDANDEPASELLKRVGLEKAKLVNLGTIRPSKPISPISQPTVRLPDNWKWSQIAEIGVLSPRNNAPNDKDASFVPMPMIAAEYGIPNEHEVRPWAAIKSGYTHFSEGDVGLAKITPCFENGKSTVFRNLTSRFGSGTTELHIVRPLLIEPNYILIFLKSPNFIQTGISKMTGTAGQKRVPLDYFAHTPFPLPPLAEQYRIIAKVEKLVMLCDALKLRISNAQKEQIQFADAIASRAVA